MSWKALPVADLSSRRVVIAFAVGMGLEFIGMLSNTLVVVLNNGMPIIDLGDGQVTTYHFGASSQYVPITATTKLFLLGDIIPIGNYVLAIGDILLWVGVTILLVGLMVYLIVYLAQRRTKYPIDK